MAEQTPGQRAYDAYRARSGGASLVSGERLPEWDGQRPDVREAWEAAARAAIEGGEPESARF